MQRTIHIVLAYLLSTILGYLLCYFYTTHQANALTITKEIAGIPVLVIYSVTWIGELGPYLVRLTAVLITLILAITYLKYRSYYLLILFFVVNGIVSYTAIYVYWALSSV